ncbi:Ribosomal RNA small subunit methyltransferase I [Mesomycoplasma dispar]|uniref:Ribosomal RNA small subunit methyltransferase I n=1 Tax=Mesomycoplasma dispar TaxID=86660 RepID=A0AAJ5TCX3_9BACT|nr:16S rRNA (cytidine(1402)-2'-O)-methyltransferase [Mesomycoplasma dispar]AJR12418.1 16S rRNA methyltransferase [Mesomycoplasma dispar]VEU62522.1 Ribosomal RNA small subunit methyltransferase I [Mesomycoplasma dispar]
MTPKITFLATPIGNLKDISLRGIEALKNADFILCEDSRISKKLLNFLEIYDKKLISYHKFNEKSVISKISPLIFSGKNIVLISDAGSPLVSDPGQILIKWAHEKKVEVDFLPGACAFVGAFVLSGFDSPLVFMGFFNSKKQQIIKQITGFKEDFSYIFYVSPYKLIHILEVIQEIYEQTIEIFLVKEMTKIHQKYFFGTPFEILNQVQNSLKGEFTMVLRLKKTKKTREKQNKYQKFSKIM